MINRNTIYVVGAMVAVAAIVAGVLLAAWSFRADDGAGESQHSGTMLHPRVQRDARNGYVIAELYQDVHLDVASGVYDEDGVLRAHHWTHDDVRQTCSIDLVLAIQDGIDQAAPTATPRPPATTVPYRPYPEGFVFAPPQAYPPYVPHQPVPPQYAGQARPLPTHTPWPTPTPYPTPRPTFTPGPTPTPMPWPTATPSPLVSSVSWIGWAERPIAIEADGAAIIDVPRDAVVTAHLSVWAGAHLTGQTRLARLPLPNPQWADGQARIRLSDASGRLLLPSNHVDAHHRTARVRIKAAPLTDCGGLGLRWEKPAAVVVKALTDQPYADWRDHRLPPTLAPTAAALSGLTLTGVALAPAFDAATTVYTASVPYSTSETTVRPALAHPGESYTIALDGIQQSADTPAVVQLATGTNAITVAVTTPLTGDTTATTTYRVTVSRETASTDASLSALALGGTSPDEWTPVFESGVYEYDVRVPHSTVRTAVQPTATHSAATFTVTTQPADALTDSGYGTALVELAEGATTTVTISVAAEDGSTTQDYVIRVHRARP